MRRPTRLTPLAWPALALAVSCASAPRQVPPAPPVEPLPPQAAFVDVPAQAAGAPEAARMFYAFRSADVDPSRAPLFVFFNGGPGSPTSLGLLPFGTGPFQVDANAGGVIANSRSFTRFGSTLHVDERHTGWSYGVGAKRSADACSFSPLADAIDFLRVILAFFDAHPSIRSAPVVLVGESYGGTRATAMYHLVMHYREGELPPDVADAIQRHLDALFPDHAGETHAPTRIATKFLGLALVEPLVLGDLQYSVQKELLPLDPVLAPLLGGKDVTNNDVRRTNAWLAALDAEVMRVWVDAGASTRLLGLDLATVPRLIQPARGPSFRANPTFDDVTERALETRFGPIASGDVYFARFGSACVGLAMGDPNWLADTLGYGRLLITHAKWDANIYTPAIPEALRRAGVTVTVDEGKRAGVARAGWFRVEMPEAPAPKAKSIEVRWPYYEDAGHMVTITQGGDFADDVRDWFVTR